MRTKTRRGFAFFDDDGKNTREKKARKASSATVKKCQKNGKVL